MADLWSLITRRSFVVVLAPQPAKYQYILHSHTSHYSSILLYFGKSRLGLFPVYTLYLCQCNVYCNICVCVMWFIVTYPGKYLCMTWIVSMYVLYYIVCIIYKSKLWLIDCIMCFRPWSMIDSCNITVWSEWFFYKVAQPELKISQIMYFAIHNSPVVLSKILKIAVPLKQN